MEANYVISEDDYVGAMKLFAKPTPKAALFYGLGAVALAFGAVFGPPIIKAGAIGGLAGGGVVALLGRFIVSPFLSRRHYRKYKAIQEPVRMRLREDGVEFSNADATGVVKWEKVFRWRQNKDYILIYPMPRMYHIVPKSIEHQGAQLGPLLEALKSNVGNET